MGAGFASLRTHSWYSWLEGTASPDALLRRAAEIGQTSLALTDSNNLCGAVEFVEAARCCGVRPILGADVRHQSQRATVLIAEQAGYRSLCTVLSRVHTQPAASLAAILAENHQGLHVLVDDPRLLRPPLTEACRGRLWLELVRPGRTEQAEQALLEAGSKSSCKPVASLRACLAAPGDHSVYRLLTAVRQSVSLDQLPGQLPVSPANHLAPDEVAREVFRDMPNALAHAATLAEACCEV
jgi:error-prone DNA polymerase